MYSFLVAAIKPASAYEFFTYKGKKPVTVMFRGKEVKIGNGTRFGVRPSSNGKHIRLVFENDPNRVITLTSEQAKELARGV